MFKKVYTLAHKRGYDYADKPKDKTLEEIEAMDVEERKQYEKEQKAWDETEKYSKHRKDVLKAVREVMSCGGAEEDQTERVERIFNKQYRPKRFNNRILTKCKIERCDKNTPLRRNVRDLLIENIVRFLPVLQEQKNLLKAALLAKNKDEVTALFKQFKINEDLRKQLRDIAYNENLSGRTVFCKEHILEHIEHTKEERKVFRIAPSLKTKIENVITVIQKEVLPKYTLDRVVMESNNFDIAAKTQGKKRLAKEEYGKGQSEDKKPRLERLVEETGGRCVYCGKGITKENAEKDHIFPVKAGGSNIYSNLVASCKECNGPKKGRTPLESGYMPNPDVVRFLEAEFNKLKVKLWKIRRKQSLTTEEIMDKARRNTLELKLKILEDAHQINELDFNKYMSHASIGWRHMRDRLREITSNEKLFIDRQSGIMTAFFRRGWDFKKDRGDTKHHALDAVILASRKTYNDEGWVDASWKPKYKDGLDFDTEKHLAGEKVFKRDKSSRGAALHDRNPLSIKNNRITQRQAVTEIECGKEDAVVSDKYREKLTEAFKRFNKKKAQGSKKGECLTDEEAKQAGFIERKSGQMMSLKCRVAGTGPGQMVKVGNNVFKTNVHNVGVAVYLDEKGKKRARELKNPRLIKHFVEGQDEISGKILFTLRKGDRVMVEGENKIYPILELGTSPAIDIQTIKTEDGKTKRIKKKVIATKLIKMS